MTNTKRKSLQILENEPAPNGRGPADPSRRRFLQVLGTASAAGLVSGCADHGGQNIFPNVKGETQQIPGVAVWYSSTCGECSAGCGIKVRTREGRAVKIEGNVDHPVNRGGLCALGQSSLQALYDPDRVRQPLKRSGASFEPITWEQAYQTLGGWLKDGKKKALITSETSGALQELLTDFGSAHGVDHYVWDLLQPTALAAAGEAVFGNYGVPQYRIDRADVLVNFGADFLETWVSPCEFALGWSTARRAKKPLRFVQIEPRLSLTGANADLWLSPKPGTEIYAAAIILKILTENSNGGSAGSADFKAEVHRAVGDLDIHSASEKTGISTDKLTLTARYLHDAKAPLVLAGGTIAGGSSAYDLHLIVNLINQVLGSVGKTVVPGVRRAPKTSAVGIKELTDALNSGSIDLLMVHDTNPAFSVPAALGFSYAARKAGHIVSFSSQLDETAALADLILPANTFLESWGDQRFQSGVNSLQQPVMTPVFDTRSFGDSILQISESAGRSIAAPGGKDFKTYLKESWKKLHGRLGVSENFEDFWRKSLERGGYFTDAKLEEVRSARGNARFKVAPIKFGADKESQGDIILYPYASVKSFDGRAANRPWMQELPDPITQIAWDQWAEIHPETAKGKGLEQGDMVTIRNHYGELNVPVYITKYVQKGMVAVPIGQGHSSFGRFAAKVGGGNVLDLLEPSVNNGAAKDQVNIFGTTVQLLRARGKSDVVIVQGSDSQHGRHLAQTSIISAAGLGAGHHGDDHGHSKNDHGESHGGGHHGDHGPKQMYEQREHPLYRWGMAIDLAACNGCSACVVACYAENNIPVVGKARMSEGREMSWLRIERYYEGEAEELKVDFLPMLCQHCNNAPCEPVCPVYATYHNEEGLNAMVYNRCVGTRYCSNNCSYKVRRFNWFDYELPAPLDLQLNPDVMKRTVGIMEKCTFCVQRIAEAKDNAKDLGRLVRDGEVQPACVQSCPTKALTFGNLNDPESKVSKQSKDSRAYKVLDHHLNTQPAISYLQDKRYKI